jgi:hypothetical protein
MNDAPTKSGHRKSQTTGPETKRKSRDGSRRRIEGTQLTDEKGFTIGRQGFAMISAVEGLHLSDEMKRDLQEFDRKRLPGDERRRAIIRKYGKKPR